MMRYHATLSVMICALLLLAGSIAWCQGIYVEHAAVLVTGKPMLMGRSPWEKPPTHQDQGVFFKGWSALAPASMIPVPPEGKVEFYVYIFSDHRGRSTGRPELTVTGNKITINITEKYAGGPKTPVFEPSLWSERVVVENLAGGVYSVYLHGTLAGKIKVL